MGDFEEIEKVIFSENVEQIIESESFKLFEAKKLDNDFKRKIQTEVICLRTLEQEAIIDFFWMGLSIKDIASKMKLSPKSVRKLLEIGILTIRRRLTSLSPAKERAGT